jgi:LacI family transcriptional regulator
VCLPAVVWGIDLLLGLETFSVILRVVPRVNPRRRDTSTPASERSVTGIRRVAQEAGVSIATVSRVLGGHPHGSADVRQRVLAAAERLHYQPSAAARGLRTTRTMIVGVLVPSLANPTVVPFLRGVQHVAQAQGYAVLVADAQRSAAVERRQLDRLHAQRVDALIVPSPPSDLDYLRELQAEGLVVAEGPFDEPARWSFAAIEGAATHAACEHLAALGHRRVGFVARATARASTSGRRWALVSGACRRAGMRAERVSIGEQAHPGSVAMQLEQARRQGSLTALICATHPLAPVLLGGLGAAAVELPGACSLVIYGDSDWSAAYRPALNVIHRDLYGVARALTERVLARLAGAGELDPWQPPAAEYIARRSVAAPRNPAPV